jgi:hypothetical protein
VPEHQLEDLLSPEDPSQVPSEEGSEVPSRVRSVHCARHPTVPQASTAARILVDCVFHMKMEHLLRLSKSTVFRCSRCRGLFSAAHIATLCCPAALTCVPRMSPRGPRTCASHSTTVATGCSAPSTKRSVKHTGLRVIRPVLGYFKVHKARYQYLEVAKLERSDGDVT